MNGIFDARVKEDPDNNILQTKDVPLFSWDSFHPEKNLVATVACILRGEVSAWFSFFFFGRRLGVVEFPKLSNTSPTLGLIYSG